MIAVKFLYALILCIPMCLPGTASQADTAVETTEPVLVEDFPIPIGGPFKLVNHNGITTTDKDFSQHYMLVYFGYTYCPSICPTDLSKISRALEAVPDISKHVQPLFITIDPARDQPGILKEYIAHFHSSFIGLTGSESQIRDVAKAFKVHRVKVTQADGEKDDYLVNHSAFSYLMDKNGKLIALLPYGGTTDHFIKTLRKYVTP